MAVADHRILRKPGNEHHLQPRPESAGRIGHLSAGGDRVDIGSQSNSVRSEALDLVQAVEISRGLTAMASEEGADAVH